MTCTSCSTCSRSRVPRAPRPLPDQPATWRLFVAAPLPPQAAEEAWRALAPMRDDHPAARWLAAEKLHLTLVFLGSTQPARVASITETLAGTAARHCPFDVATGAGGGRIGDQRGGVAWLRIDEGAQQAAELAQTLDRALGSSTYDTHRQPRPHLTVARAVDATTLAALEDWAAGHSLRWRVDRIVLMRSHTYPAGSRYEELASHALTNTEQDA